MASQVSTGATPASPPGGAPARPARKRRPWVIAGVVAILVVIIALALLLRATPGATLARAVDATVAEGTAATTVTGTVKDVPIAGDLTLSIAEGELDLAGERAQLRRELPLVSGLDVPVVGEIGDVELLYAEGGAWLRAPIDGERSWVRLRDAQDDAASSAPGLGNPLALLALIRAVEGTPEELDREPVGGVEATRYRVMVDLDAVDGELGAGSRRLLDGLRRLHEGARLPLDVWVGDDGLIRRIAYEVDVDLSGVPQLRLGTDVRLDDHGMDVAIEPPGDGEVVEVSADRLRELELVRLLREWAGRLPFVGD